MLDVVFFVSFFVVVLDVDCFGEMATEKGLAIYFLSHLWRTSLNSLRS